ncbi:MAG: cupin domain-containing protein [Gammaproteobacteria bacterium]|nr:cupin domain-containing protein [Gammaproteobacteria bacterium]
MFARPLRFPSGIDADVFLRDYWQKRPLLMRQALPRAAFTVDADRLAGLACEPDIESRLIIEDRTRGWQLRHGPFDVGDFAALPESHWTLLVQDVDKYLDDVAALVDHFDFVPGWRIDDIMISYASHGGGVGPHIDAYDVFLMQAAGRRRWRLSHRAYTDADLLPGLEQRILSSFSVDDDWLLGPGDVLYLPPGIAHWGTADGDCMTYSLGFRAPDQRELAGDWFQHVVAAAGDARLADPDGIPAARRSELTPEVLAQARELLRQLPTPDSDAFGDWLGCYVTQAKPQFEIVPRDTAWTAHDLDAWLDAERPLRRHPAARLAWARHASDGLRLYCHGDVHRLPDTLGDAVGLLCDSRQLPAAALRALIHNTPGARTLLLDLVNDGVLEAEPQD